MPETPFFYVCEGDLIMKTKPYITLEEALATRQEGKRSIKFLTEANGCVNGCCSGVTIYSETEFDEHPGFHDNQEGFFVLEGEGYAWLDGEEFPIKAGDSFIALPGVKHTIKTKNADKPVKVFWFHSGV